MNWLASPRDRLRFLLWLVAAHSVGVGVGLILHPPAFLDRMGFAPINEHFFPVQGGVFHLLVAVAYVLGGRAPERHRSLIVFAVVVKAAAAVFLITYWLLNREPWSVPVSGVVDGLMAAAIALALRAADGRKP